MKLDDLKRAYPPLSEAGQARFLRTLTGTQPRIQHPVLPTSTLDTPRPE